MKKKFHPIGITERDADRQLWWTIGWALLTLVVSIVFLLQP
jgi:hypothetical protein